jgi:hypothetical protein
MLMTQGGIPVYIACSRRNPSLECVQFRRPFSVYLDYEKEPHS